MREIKREIVLPLIEAYRHEHGHYPSTLELRGIQRRNPKSIPNIRTIQREIGIRCFYEKHLGLKYSTNRTAAVIQDANLNALNKEYSLGERLSTVFGANNVHHRPPYENQSSTWLSADFKVYVSPSNFFYVDIFSPKDMASLIGCVNIKLKKLSRIPMPKRDIFFVAEGSWVDQLRISRYLPSRKKRMPSNITLLHVDEAMRVFEEIARNRML